MSETDPKANPHESQNKLYKQYSQHSGFINVVRGEIIRKNFPEIQEDFHKKILDFVRSGKKSTSTSQDKKPEDIKLTELRDTLSQFTTLDALLNYCVKSKLSIPDENELNILIHELINVEQNSSFNIFEN